MDQSKAPILDGLARYWERGGHYAFTPPGHKHGKGADPRARYILGDDVFCNDLLSSSGLDTRDSSGGLLSTAQELAADAVGADSAIFSTCGSSLAVKAAMIACAGRGVLAVGRDAHKSIASGLVLGDIVPAWIPPVYDEELHLAHPPSPESVRQVLDWHLGTKAVLVTSPTPYGTCADLEAIAELVHGRGLPLIVDEAWGAHLPWHDELPTWAINAGADVAVVSVHKAGSGLEQGSVISVQGDLVDLTRLSHVADMLSTTSANVLILAAIDGWRRQMVQHGREMLDRTIRLARGAGSLIDDITGLHVATSELAAMESSADLDPHVITVDVSELGITGYQAADWLREQFLVDMGLSDHRRVCAQFALGDDEQTAERLVHALTALSVAAREGELGAGPDVYVPSWRELALDQVMTPADAFYREHEDVPVGEAAGRIAAEQVTPYPPGIPVALPGERLNAEVIRYLSEGVAAGMVLPDASDPEFETVRVVA